MTPNVVEPDFSDLPKAGPGEDLLHVIPWSAV